MCFFPFYLFFSHLILSPFAVCEKPSVARHPRKKKPPQFNVNGGLKQSQRSIGLQTEISASLSKEAMGSQQRSYLFATSSNELAHPTQNHSLPPGVDQARLSAKAKNLKRYDVAEFFTNLFDYRENVIPPKL